MQAANCTSGASRRSASCSRTLRHAAQLSPDLGFEPATFRSLADLLNDLLNDLMINAASTCKTQETAAVWFCDKFI